jgi:hypothetical protein
MTAIRSLISPLVVIAASLVIPACYTLLKHPTVDEAAYEEVQTNPCTSCHYEDDLWFYHHSAAHRPYPGSISAGWGYYYAAPWWYESYWDYASPSGPSTIPLPSRQLRPSGDKDRTEGAIGGPIGPPPSAKSTGSTVRFRHSDGDSVANSKDTVEKKTNDDDTTKRDVRPKTAKEKPKGKGGKGD